MIDLHTHILPGMDDGAADPQTACAMLRMEAEQGVDTVALTPHFYRTREHADDFLHRRRDAMELLSEALEGETYPRLILGAEVAWFPGLADLQELDELCYEGSKMLLVELPFLPWNEELFRQLYSLEGGSGVTPVIAHVERYYGLQEKKRLRQLTEMGFPMQVSAEGLLHRSTRRHALGLLTKLDSMLISDCHDLTNRPPNIGPAMAVLEKKLGVDGGQFAAEEFLFD